MAAVVALLATFSLPAPPADPTVTMAVSLVRVVLLYAFLVWATLRRERAAPEGGSAPVVTAQA